MWSSRARVHAHTDERAAEHTLFKAVSEGDPSARRRGGGKVEYRQKHKYKLVLPPSSSHPKYKVSHKETQRTKRNQVDIETK